MIEIASNYRDVRNRYPTPDRDVPSSVSKDVRTVLWRCTVGEGPLWHPDDRRVYRTEGIYERGERLATPVDLTEADSSADG